mgnify:CR=1 FL=1
MTLTLGKNLSVDAGSRPGSFSELITVSVHRSQGGTRHLALLPNTGFLLQAAGSDLAQDLTDHLQEK